MSSQNFDFLAPDFPEIYNKLSRAERDLLDDPSTSLSLMRTSAELMLRLVAESALPFEDLKEKKFASLHRYLSTRRGIVPSHIADDLQQVWDAGNPAVHLAIGDRSRATAMHKRCHQIAVWLHGKFSKSKDPIPGEYRPVDQVARAVEGASGPVAGQGSARNCWIMRPYPHRIYRLQEFIANSIIAIGWPFIGDIEKASRDEVLRRLEDKYKEEPRRWHTDSRATILRFRDKVSVGDAVVLASNADHTREVAICVVHSPYVFDPTMAADEVGYAHQRKVRFLKHRTHGLMIDRRHLPSEAQTSMTQGTLHRTESGPLLAWLSREQMV